MIWIEEEHHINGSISSKLFEIQVSVSNNIWLWGLVTGCCWFSLVVTSCYRLLLVQQHWQLTWRLNRHILLHPFLVLIVLCQLFSSTFSTSSTLNFFYKLRERTPKVGEVLRFTVIDHNRSIVKSPRSMLSSNAQIYTIMRYSWSIFILFCHLYMLSLTVLKTIFKSRDWFICLEGDYQW